MVERALRRWQAAGLLDAQTVARITAWEQAHAGRNRFNWPALIALALGALAVGAGVLLFVAAHWDTLSPTARFSLVLALVAGFHLGGVACRMRFPALATALHGLGTAALGAGIFLAAQIFHLQDTGRRASCSGPSAHGRAGCCCATGCRAHGRRC